MKYPYLLLGAACLVLGGSFSSAQAAPVISGSLNPDSPQNSILVAADSDVATQGAEAFVDKLAQEGIGFLADVSMSNDQRRAEFESLLNSKFDLNTIARFTLGRYWNSANQAQQKEYTKLFKNMIVEVYSRRFSDYQGQELVVKNSRPEGSGKDVLVHSVIVPASGPEVSVDWRVRQKDSGYKIVDVIVEGVSMAVTQRSEFASVIQRGGGDVQVLIDHLQSQTN